MKKIKTHLENPALMLLVLMMFVVLLGAVATLTLPAA